MKTNFLAGCFLLIFAGAFMLTGCPGLTAPAKYPPQAPTNLTAVPADSKVTLSWEYPDTKGIAGVQTDYGIGSFTNTQDVDFPAGVTPNEAMEITSLTNQERYQFRVRAKNQDGWGEWSATVYAKPEVWTTAPEAPVPAIDLSRSEKGTLYVSWPAVAGADKYNVKYGKTNKESDAAWWPSEDAAITGIYTTIENLDRGTLYYVFVRAGNARGNSSWASVSGTTLKEPDKVTGVTTTWANQQVTLQWTVPASDSPITSYEIGYGTTDFDQTKTAGANAIGAVVTGLVNETEYQFRIRAKSAIGDGIWSDTLKETPRPASSAPAAPTGVTVVRHVAPKEIKVQWNPVQQAERYKIKYNTADTETGAAELSDVITDIAFTITGLADDTAYYIWVWAWNNYNSGSDGPATKITGKTMGVPAAPDFEFDMILADVRQLLLTWTREENVTANEVRYALSSLNITDPMAATAWTANITTAGTIITGLQDLTGYDVWVRAQNVVGWSDWTKKTGTTKAPILSGLAVSYPAWYSTRGQLQLHWDPVEDALQYEIRWNSTNDPNGSNVKTTTISATKTIGVAGVGPGQRTVPVTDSGYRIFNLNTGLSLTNMTNPNTWYVWVTALEEGGVKGVSASGSTAGIPALGIDARVQGDLTVKWSAVSGATAYELMENTEKNFRTATPVTGAALTTRSYTVTGIGNAAERHFWVRSVNSSGTKSVWCYAKGVTQDPAVVVQMASAPPYTVPGNRPNNQKMSVVSGNHPTLNTTWVTGAPMIKRNSAYVLLESGSPLAFLGYTLGAPRQAVLDRPQNAPIAAALAANQGKQWFDTVILFNAGLRDRDCLNDGPSQQVTGVLGSGGTFNVNGKPDNHNCNRQGLHMHMSNALQYVLENRDIYIKPLQDAGINVIVSILGDWSGVRTGTFGDWPFEDVSPIAGPGHPGETKNGAPGQNPPAKFRDASGNPYYRYHSGTRDAFLNEINNFLNTYQLDGVDIDDEWWNASTYEYDVVYASGGQTWIYSVQPRLYSYYEGSLDSAATSSNANNRIGKNCAQFVIALRETIGPDKQIHIYESSQYDAPEFHQVVQHPYTGEIVRVSDYYTWSSEGSWGSAQPISSIGSPAAQYSRTAWDFTESTRARPTMSGTETSSAYGQIVANLADGGGWTTAYGLYSRYRYNGGRREAPKGQPTRILDDYSSFFNQTTGGSGSAGMPELYFSIMSEVLHGAPVIFTGNPDHHGPWLDRRLEPWEAANRALNPDVD